MKSAEYWNEHTRQLPPLKVGDFVRIQNQTGQYSKRWDKTGTVIEVRQHDQYVIRVDGSGRVTNRNRKFLRKYSPVQPPQPTRTIEQDSWHLTAQKPIYDNYMTKESKQRDDVTNQQTPEPSYLNQDDDEPLIPPQAPPDVPVPQTDTVPRVQPVPQVLPVPNEEKKEVKDAVPSESEYKTRSGRVSKRPDYYVALMTDQLQTTRV